MTELIFTVTLEKAIFTRDLLIEDVFEDEAIAVGALVDHEELLDGDAAILASQREHVNALNRQVGNVAATLKLYRV